MKTDSVKRQLETDPDCKQTGKCIRGELDALFVVSSEAVEGKGEDSFCCSCTDDAAIMGVFDGCGGLGSRQYDHYEKHTGAYIASRLASGAVYNWFQTERRLVSPDKIPASLKARITAALRDGMENGGSTLKLRGSMVRDFPATAAVVMAVQGRTKTFIRVFWAGDSRVYLLGRNGLMPLSRDDTDSEDAFDDLRNDPVQTNVLSSDGNYTLHERSFASTGPLLIVAASDGYFGYWNTPMEFEFFLLDTLNRSSCLDEWKASLRSEIQDVTGDDATLAVMAFQFGTFSRMKSVFKDRYQRLKKHYIDPLKDSCPEEKARALWMEYKKGYGKYL